MLELMFCSMLTILPDFLIRRFFQGKRIGHEITLFSVWYELRWGITACVILTISLITLVFYYHPSTSNVASYFRTVTILPERLGRVSEVHVISNQIVKKGDLLFKLDTKTEEAKVETARKRVSEVDAAIVVAQADLEVAASGVDQAEAAYKQIELDYQRQKELHDRDSPAARQAELDRLTSLLNVREAQLESARASYSAAEDTILVQLPAQKDSANAQLVEAENKLNESWTYAGVDGRIEQFDLRVGDFVNPLARPAGLLVPLDSGRDLFQAGFSQLAVPVIKRGMVVEMTCLSKPFTVIPMVVTNILDVIPSGQFRPSDRLIDLQNNAQPGTLTVRMEPIYAGQTSDIPPGSKCLANAYTNNHDLLDDEGLSTGRWIFLHVVDTVGLVHAIILRIQVLMLPVQSLVFSGH